MTIEKTVSARSPYIGRTFQRHTNLLAGRSGYVSGASASDDGADITIGPYAFMQSGLVVEQDAQTTGLNVPVGAEPWFVLASSSNDDPASGVNLSATNDLPVATAGTIIAYKVNGVWRNPVPLSMVGLEGRDAANAGREEGFSLRTSLTGTDVDTIEISRGQAIGPDGVRRVVDGPTAGPSTIESLVPYAPNPANSRVDHIVLRQISGEPSAKVAYIQGATFAADSLAGAAALTTLAAASVNERPHYFAKKGGAIADQWWAWGQSNTLYIQTGRLGSPVALVAAAATIANTFVVGQRASDDAIIVLYTEGDDLKMLSFDPATDTIVDAAVIIDTQGNGISHVRAALDYNEECHVVYQHDENNNGLDEQVYYTRRSTVAASFAASSVSPRIVDGSDSGNSDTGPVIGVDRMGIAHVAYITGASGTAQAYGELRYSTISQGGVTTAQTTYSNVGDVGRDVDPDDLVPIEVYTASGNDMDDVSFVDLVVTVHDEVYAIVAGFDSGDADRRRMMLFSPAFGERIGYEIVDLGVTLPGEINECAISADDQGALYCTANHYDGSSDDVLRIVRVDTVFAKDGLVGPSLLSFDNITTAIGTSFAGEYFLAQGYLGDFELSQADGAAAKSLLIALNGVSGTSRARTPTPHEQDVYLASWFVPASGVADQALQESEFAPAYVRPKRMNYPFIVGDGGDFTGFNSLIDAVGAANRHGGTIIVRDGDHRLNDTLLLRSNVRIIGEGMPRLTWQAAAGSSIPWIKVAPYSLSAVTPSAINGQILTMPSLAQVQTIRPGDLVRMTTSGDHRVVRAINNKVVLDGVAPVGDMLHYPTGTVLENLLLTGEQPTDEPVHLNTVNKFVMRNCVLRLDVAATNNIGVLLGLAIDSVLEGCDFSDYNYDVTNLAYAVYMESGESNRVDGCLFRGGYARLRITNDEERPRIIGCMDATDPPSLAVYSIDNSPARTTNIEFIGNIGSLTGDAGSPDWIYTSVGTVIESLIGDTLGFKDKQTALGAITDDIIRLADGSNREFNGATNNVITASVNERVLRAGDTMTGELTIDDSFADTHLRLESNAAQVESLVEVVGRLGMMPMLLQPTGMWQTKGNYLRDQFLAYNGDVTATTLPSHVWEDIATGGGAGAVVSATDLIGLAISNIGAGGGPPDYAIVRTINSPASIVRLPCINAKVRVGGAITGITDMDFGIGFLSRGSPAAAVRLAYSSALSANWILQFTDDVPSAQYVSTGLAVVSQADVYLTMCVTSSTSVFYRIGAAAEWNVSDTIAHVTSLPGSGILEVGAAKIDMEVAYTGGGSDAREAWIRFVEFWELS